MRQTALARTLFAAVIFSLLAMASTAKAQEKPIVHDAQYYILNVSVVRVFGTASWFI